MDVLMAVNVVSPLIQHKVTGASCQSDALGPKTRVARGDWLELEPRIPALFLEQTEQLLREKPPDPDTFDGVCEH